MSKLRSLAFPIVTAYLWVMMILFGAIVLETFMIYPNVFSDPPLSLELAMDFMSVAGPADFFPPLGLLSWILGTAALFLCWPVKSARWWILFSLIAILCEGVASMLYFWPRNTIMFVEGQEAHSAAYLRQVAQEFETWHWRSRLGFNAASAASIFVGFLRFYRHRLRRELTISADMPAASTARANG
jgi:hypothetical protein